jgi:hypothetical protein
MTEEEMRALIEARTRQSKELFIKHFSKVPDELSLIVLKGHLLVEQSLTAIISHYAQPSADIAKVNLRFVQKMALAKALVPSFFCIPQDFWNFVDLLNHLRNDLAHQLESKKLDGHLESLRTMFEAHRKFFEVEHYPTDAWKLKSLIGLWLGVLDPIDALIHTVEKAKVYNVDLLRLAELAREICQKWPEPTTPS